MARLEGKVAIVVGAAGGIGRASAVCFAQEGAHCVLVGRGDAARLDDVCAGLAGDGHMISALDIADSNGLAALCQQVQSRYGRADILVNTAGFTKMIPHHDLQGLTDELIDEMFKINWRAVFATIRAFAPLMRATGDGLVANISSIAATTGVGSNIAYCAVKAATDSMTATLARVLAPQVRVVSISPGVVDTTFVPGRDEEWKRKQAESSPLAHLVTPQDIAEAILSTSLHLRYTTGSVIQIDSGRHLQ